MAENHNNVWQRTIKQRRPQEDKYIRMKFIIEKFIMPHVETDGMKCLEN